MSKPKVELCPRPINKGDDDSAAWCVLAGHCGCDHPFKLTQRDLYNRLHTGFQRVLAERDAMEACLRNMVSAQHAGDMTDEQYRAWESARDLIVSTDNSRMKCAANDEG